MSVEAAAGARVIAAGGTRQRPAAISAPAPARRILLLIELGVLFIAVPLLMRYAIYGFRLPLYMVITPVFVALIVYLLWDDTFHVIAELKRGFRAADLRSILALFAVFAVAVTAVVAWLAPADLFAFPLNRPTRWRRLMIMYPLLSVVAQEFIYRTFFFHRYGPLFGEARWLMIAVNGIAFGLAHVIIGNWVSVALTTLFGFLLAWRYQRTGSFWAVWVEHSLYGCMIFSVGLGHYFFTGVPTFLR